MTEGMLFLKVEQIVWLDMTKFNRHIFTIFNLKIK